MKTNRLAGAMTAVAVALAAAACGGAKQLPPAAPSGAASHEAPRTPTALVTPNTPTASNIAISDDIRRACKISDEDAYFAFDSSRVTQGDRSPLDAVAACFTRGPLAGRSVHLVGHADPRGSTDYNMTLGQSRADAVAGYLDSHGMTSARTPATTRGAMDATGTDEATWAKDRRVDLKLAD
jgi:peptidoglycan-associated lipoprotein